MFKLVPNTLQDTLCIVVTIIVALYNYWCMKNDRKGTGYVFFVIYILLFSLLYRPVNGDFWHYLEAYQIGTSVHNNLEDVYNWLMDVVPDNFILWRICIWLPAAIILMITLKLMKIPSCIATLFFLMFGLINVYYYTRNVLGSAVLYLALVIYGIKQQPLKHFFNLIIVVGLFIVSWYLHKSMPLYIGLALLALFLPLNNATIRIALIAFPLLYLLTYAISFNLLQLDIWLTDETGLNYLESANSEVSNWKGKISLVIKYIPVIYFYVIAFKTPLSKTIEEYHAYKTFLLLGFFILYLSFLFIEQGSSVVQGRLYKSSMIPFAFAVSIYFKHNKGSKYCNSFIVLMALYYCWILFVTLASSL